MPSDDQALDVLSSYLLDYQRAWLLDRSRRRVWLKGRQLGATQVGIALDGLLEALEWPHDIYVFSNRHDSAKEILRDVVYWLDVFQAVGVHFDAQISATQIEIAGSRIIALPATAEAGRGKRGSLYVDEAATIRRDLEFWQAIKPVLDSSKRYRVSLVSTPLGARGLFHDVCTNDDPSWSRHRTTILQAIDQGLDRDLEDIRRSSHNFDQEYMCNFDAGGTYFQIGALLALDEFREDREGEVTLGVDLGKVHDPSSIVGMRDGHVFGSWVMRSVHYKTQREAVGELALELGATRVAVDATKHPSFADELEADLKPHGISVIAVHFTNQWKARVVPALRDDIEEASIAFDFEAAWEWREGEWVKHGGRPLLDDLCKIEQTYTPGGLLKFDARRDATGHADTASALFLAHDAQNNPTTINPFAHLKKHLRKKSSRSSILSF